MTRRGPAWPWAALCLLAVLALGACEAPKPKFKMPARLLYDQGERLLDQQLYSEAIVKFQKVADENPGTMLGSYAYLQIAEARVQQDNLDEADTNFRLFLGSQQTSHLTPYVLYRLAQVNHLQSYTGVFFPTRETDRDQGANRQLIQDYQRFYFLYPDSPFLPQVRAFAKDARTTLAAHERNVGDFYFNRKYYTAAASRYLYLLRHYPEYPDAQAVLQRLIVTYRRNQQPKLAAELARLHQEFEQAGTAQQAPAPPHKAAAGPTGTAPPAGRVASTTPPPDAPPDTPPAGTPRPATAQP